MPVENSPLSLGQPLTNVLERLAEHLPSILGAVLLLLAGWLVAWLLQALTSRILGRLHRLVAGQPVDQEMKSSGIDRLATDAVGTIIFWLVLLLFLAAAGEMLGLSVVTTGITRLAQYLPSILGAVLVMLAGFVLARLGQASIQKAAATAGMGHGRAVGQAARIIILLVATVIALDQIGIESGLLIVSTNILIASAVGGAALAFALGSRTAVGNILALHYLTQTYKVGQRVRLSDLEGEIVTFKKNGVVIASADGEVLVPASEFSEKRSVLLREPGA